MQKPITTMAPTPQPAESLMQAGEAQHNQPQQQMGPPANTPDMPSPQGAAAEGDLAARRTRKRDRLYGDSARDNSWSLKRKLAALSHDVELLSSEVARLRREAEMSTAAPELTPEEKAILAEKHAKKLAETQKRGISVMLRDIMQHKWAFPFNKPVDTNLYKDYLLRVSKPMDFGTIKSRMEAGAYLMRTDAFTEDMRQVFENAFTFNAPGSDVHSMALTLKDKFEERMKGLASRMAAAETERSKEEDEMRELARRRLQEKALEGLGVHRSRLDPIFSALDSRIREAKSDAAKSCGFVSLPEKQALVDALSELKPEDFEFAIQLVVNRHPGLLQPNSEEMDIDLEPLDSLTLRQLAAFARCCLKGHNSDSPACWPGLLFGSGVPGLRASSVKRSRPGSAAAQSPAAQANELPSPAQDPAATMQQQQPGQQDAEAPPVQMPAEGTSVLPPQQIPATGPPIGSRPIPGATPAGMIYHTRSIGERSWSVLDRAAHRNPSTTKFPGPRPAPLKEEELQEQAPQQPVSEAQRCGDEHTVRTSQQNTVLKGNLQEAQAKEENTCQVP